MGYFLLGVLVGVVMCVLAMLLARRWPR